MVALELNFVSMGSFCFFTLLISNFAVIGVMPATIGMHFETCNQSYYVTSNVTNNDEQIYSEGVIDETVDENDRNTTPNIVINDKISTENIVPVSIQNVSGKIDENSRSDSFCQFPFTFPGRVCSANCVGQSGCIPGLYVPQYTTLNCVCDNDYTLTTISSDAYCIGNTWFPGIPQCVSTEEFNKSSAVIKPADVETKVEESSIKSQSDSFCQFPFTFPGRVCSANCVGQSGCIPGLYVPQYTTLNCVCDNDYTLTTTTSDAYCIGNIWFPEIPQCVSVLSTHISSSTTPVSQVRLTQQLTTSTEMAISNTMPETLSADMCQIPDLSIKGSCSVLCEEDTINCTYGWKAYQFTTIYCSCNNGYLLSTDYAQFFCIGGEWLPNVPECRRKFGS